MFDTAVLLCKKKKREFLLLDATRMSAFLLGPFFCTFERYRIARQVALLTGHVTACYKKIKTLVLF